MQPVITAWRALRLATHIALGLGLALVIAAADRAGRRPRWTARVVRWWHTRCCRALGLRIAVSGKPLSAALLVANHISWLDILVLGAQGQISFLSKAEVRKWPLIGWMAAVAGTLFITRGASQTAALTAAIGDRVRNGQCVVIFPEATTSDGSGLLRFHPRLFAIGQQAQIKIQPVALRYGAGPSPDRIAPYIGDDTFLPHLFRVLRHRGLAVRVQFLAPIDPPDADRRQLAEQARKAIGGALGLPPTAPARARRAHRQATETAGVGPAQLDTTPRTLPL
jgi:1-acyl-sn-glycerol-3-phosphate acyltransferase